MLHVDATEAIHYDNTLLLFVNEVLYLFSHPN